MISNYLFFGSRLVFKSGWVTRESFRRLILNALLWVAKADVPANGMKQFSVEGIDVLMVNAGDAFVACQAMCPHEAVPLEQGIHDGSTLTCMEHMWQFDLKTGGPLGDAQEGLKEYRLKEEHGDLYIALEG